MNQKFMLRRLFVFAFALALYATKVGTAHIPATASTPTEAQQPVQAPAAIDPDAVVLIPDPAAPQIPDFQDVQADEEEPQASGQYLQEATVMPGDLSPAQETLAMYGGRKVIRRYQKPATLNKPRIESDQTEPETNVGEDYDPTAPLERLSDGTAMIKRRYLVVMGVKVDLAEIDLLVETEIAAGALKTREQILSFRREAIDRKAQQLREALRTPSSVKKSSL